MSTVVPASSTIRFTLTAAQKIAVYSQGAFKVTQVGTYVNAPNAPTELVDRAANGLAYTSSAFATGGLVEVDAYGGLPCYVEVGTDPVVKQGQAATGTQVAAVAVNATLNPLPSASLLTGRITSTSAAATDITLPTGTLLYAATTWLPGEYFDWIVYNSGPSLVRLLPGTNHTVLSGASPGTTEIAVPTLTSVRVRTTLVSVSGAVGTFVTEAIARPVS